MDSSNSKSAPLSRRRFIRLGAQGTIGISLMQLTATPAWLLSGCQSEAAKTIYGACYHDCPDTCSWQVKVVGDKITEFGPHPTAPFTGGKLCNKMAQFPDDITYHPERVLTPLKRIGNKGEGKFTPVSWEEALKTVAGKTRAVIDQHGGEAVLPYSFAGTQGLVQQHCMSSRFFARIGATQLERTICGAPAVTGMTLTNGKSTGILPEDIVHSRFIILWGTNTKNSNPHLWPYIEKARQKGARLVVIDPFLSQTAEEADWFIQLLPGTDTALALGMMNVILEEELYDKHYVENYTFGLEELKEHVKNYPPDEVAEITGLKAATIGELAREYARCGVQNPSVIRVLVGLEHQAQGATAFRAVAMLPALTGAWQYHGGGLLHMTYELFGEALNWERIDLGKTLENPETRSVNMVQIGRALTDPKMNPPVMALFVYNANPAVIAPDQNAVIRGLEREDLFTVVLEHFITDTARYADYILPATTQLEHWDLMDSWGHVYLNLNQPAIDPLGESKPNSEIFRLLAQGMNLADDYFQETDLEIIEKTLDSNHRFMEGITFESLKKTGWAKLNLPKPLMPLAIGSFKTPSGKCEFYSERLVEKGLSPMPEYQPVLYSKAEKESWPLHLLTVKSPRHFLNTSHANVKHLREKEGDPVLDIHPSDAEIRGLSDGDLAKVSNNRGELTLTVRLSEHLRSGVVCMPQGHWPSLLKGGSSANALTQDRLTDMGRGAALQEAKVQVVKV